MFIIIILWQASGIFRLFEIFANVMTLALLSHAEVHQQIQENPKAKTGIFNRIFNFFE